MCFDEKVGTDGDVIVKRLFFDAAFELAGIVDFKFELGSVVFRAGIDTVDAEAVGIVCLVVVAAAAACVIFNSASLIIMS